MTFNRSGLTIVMPLLDVIQFSVWYVDFTITQEGIHSYEFKGTGAVVTAEESSFRVRRRAVA